MYIRVVHIPFSTSNESYSTLPYRKGTLLVSLVNSLAILVKFFTYLRVIPIISKNTLTPIYLSSSYY